LKNTNSLSFVKTMNKLSLIKNINNLTHIKSIILPLLIGANKQITELNWYLNLTNDNKDDDCRSNQSGKA